MLGISQVPPNDSAGTGKAEVSYDDASHMLTWTITYSGLTGDATAAHLQDTQRAAEFRVAVRPDGEREVQGFASVRCARA